MITTMGSMMMMMMMKPKSSFKGAIMGAFIIIAHAVVGVMIVIGFLMITEWLHSFTTGGGF